jgi:hypothetical protein
MEKRKFPVVSIIFYVLAFILLAYAIWAAIYSIDYVSQAIEQNQLVVEGFEFEIASFYMTNVAQYVVFAAILFGIGWILQKMAPSKTTEWEEEILAEEMWVEEDETPEEEEEETLGVEETPYTD